MIFKLIIIPIIVLLPCSYGQEKDTLNEDNGIEYHEYNNIKLGFDFKYNEDTDCFILHTTINSKSWKITRNKRFAISFKCPRPSSKK